MTVKSITLVPRSQFPGYGVLVCKVTVESSAFSFRVQGQTVRHHIPRDCSFILTALHTTSVISTIHGRNVKICMHTALHLVKLKGFKSPRIL